MNDVIQVGFQFVRAEAGTCISMPYACFTQVPSKWTFRDIKLTRSQLVNNGHARAKAREKGLIFMLTLSKPALLSSRGPCHFSTLCLKLAVRCHKDVVKRAMTENILL